ncbi:VOC family protein [Brevibacterium litoralis]|uniref:VOC family protein n=1 Tax=Brevibacterium litoralis TaxID=3138935 RepID=UPI0032EAD1FF
MTTTARTFLMFEGDAEAAMHHYVEVFGGEILSLTRHPDELPPEQVEAMEQAKAAGMDMQMNDVAGKVLFAAFRIADQTIYCSDSSVQHAFGFTPSVSLFVEVAESVEVDRIASALGDGGAELMPPSDEYGFSPRFAWVQDRWGVTWQISSRPLTY